MIHESLKKVMDAFNYDAHPMGMLIATVAAMSTFYPEARDVHDPAVRTKQIHRLIAKMPTVAAFAYKHSMGMPYVYPSNDLDYTANFLTMLFKTPAEDYKPNPILVRALDVLFILHADHEQNCGTNAMRGIGSAHTDPYSAVAGAAAALYGPLHGGANEEVLKMLQEIGSVDRVPAFIEEVKQGKGEKRLMGFGHRVYKNFDPRAKIIKRMAEEVFEVTGRNPLLDIALELERIALQDEYFIKRKLYPNVDFYSGLIYEAIGIPSTAFTVLFAIPRTAGWLAQWEELLEDPEEKIARPRQVYLGHGERRLRPDGEALTRAPSPGARGGASHPGSRRRDRGRGRRPARHPFRRRSGLVGREGRPRRRGVLRNVPASVRGADDPGRRAGRDLGRPHGSLPRESGDPDRRRGRGHAGGPGLELGARARDGASGVPLDDRPRVDRGGHRHLRRAARSGARGPGSPDEIWRWLLWGLPRGPRGDPEPGPRFRVELGGELLGRRAVLFSRRRRDPKAHRKPEVARRRAARNPARRRQRHGVVADREGAGRRATGPPAFRFSPSSTRRCVTAPSRVDLADFWKKLGVSSAGGRIVYDETAPLAAIRLGITTGSPAATRIRP